jgi:hypothetical protein
VKLSWAIDADSDEKVVFFEELAPFIVKQCAIGLHCVFKFNTRLSVLFLQLDGTPVKVNAHKSGFTPLPGNSYLRAAVGFDKLPDVTLKHYV